MSEDKTVKSLDEAKGIIEDAIGQGLDRWHEQQKEKRMDSGVMPEVIERARERSVKRDKMTKAQAKEHMSNLVGALGAAGGNKDEAAKIAKSLGDDLVEKTLVTSTIAGGGVLIAPEIADEIIGLLRADTVIMESGAREIPMESGVLSYGRTATGATAAYRGEAAAATVSGPTLGAIELKAKILDVLYPASEQLLTRSGGAGYEFVQEELARAARDRMDSAFIRADGGVHTPRGLRWQAANTFNETNVGGATGTSTVAERLRDLGAMMGLLANANVAMARPGWLLSPRTWRALFTMLDANSNHILKDEMLQSKTIYGIPFRVTSNIPQTLTAAAGSGAGVDASEVYLTDFFDVLVGVTKALTLSVSTEGTYVDGGVTFSAFQRGEVLFKATMEHDLALRHPQSCVVLTSCTWGTI